MKPISFALAAGLLAGGGAQAQLLDDAPAPKSLSSAPALSQPFAKVQPVPRTYMGNAAEPVGLPNADKSAFGVYVADPKLFGGINVSPNFAIETGYANLYTRGYHFADYARADEVKGALGTKGFNSYLAAKVNVPDNDVFSAYGKVGVAYSERVAHDKTLRATTSDADVGAYAGMGARYKLNEKATVSAQYEQYGNSAKKWGSETNNSGLSAKFKMGF
jgi:opacity protein-like surface antigen